MLHPCVVSPERVEKKRKEIINNNLAVLPNHGRLLNGISNEQILYPFLP